MATIIDEYLDSPIDNDDVFPCKGCGEILEEGKSFELAGNRWHLDCFRCNTCSTLLDSDANLLLLGDGSLICNNCTYSCTACGNKIEDLAILTGDQAFCATCFRCRNCKRKIENLRYARTSQGIFCMGCHETLMARRRKKSKAASSSKNKESSPMVEKSLPALPPSAVPTSAFVSDRVDQDSDTPTELSPRPRAAHTHNESSSRGSSRPARSPEREPSSKSDGLTLPASSYRKNRNSTLMQGNEGAANDSNDSFFISVALDPSPGPNGTPRLGSDSAAKKDKDYFGMTKTNASTEKRADSLTSTPHIAFQNKGRQHSSDQDSGQLKSQSRKLSRSSEQENDKGSNSDEFKLQEAPRTKRTGQPGSDSPAINGAVNRGGLSPSEPRRTNENLPPSRSSQDSRAPQDDEEMRDSLDSVSRGGTRADAHRAIPRKEIPPPPPPPRHANGKPTLATRAATSDDVSMAMRPPGPRPNVSDTYMQPRSAPAPPPAGSHGQAGNKDEQTSPKVSPKLPRWSSGGDFSLDEDMARILGTDQGSSSILRRVSNVVRHGRTASAESSANLGRAGHARSISETTRATASPRWPKTPLFEDPNGHHEISSPVSLTSGDDPGLLKRQLRNSEQRVAELERQFNTEKDLKSLNKKLIEKRKTVSVLDTQTEIMIRQLEVLAGYVERAKETKTPVDPRELEDSAIKDFVQKLDKVKVAMAASIEQLHEERDKLIEEKDQAVADRDRALMEFEQLSSKNAQLADMNNDLTHQIQERFKSQIGGEMKSTNGLGIYSQNKMASGSSSNLDTASMTTGATLIADDDAILESGPTVVQVRKGQVKKFNWKKGSKTMAQNVAKGVNRAVVAFQQNERERYGQPGLAGDNIGLPYNMTVTQVEGPSSQGLNGINRMQTQPFPGPGGPGDPGRPGFGFFGKKPTFPKSASGSAMMVPDAAEPPSTLFGSDLSERTDYERRQIPNVVTRCIEEVELRGMDQEGIYRKTGGNSQVNAIKDGFDKNESFDISDPDLDITAVTSVLKQYFRKLPTPLLTFDVYERVLESNAIIDEDERCTHLHKTFSSMPQAHYDCLEFLMFHLHRVQQREPENLMSPKNLAVVFAPTIMRDLSIEREMVDMHSKNLAVQFVVENTHAIFEKE